MKTINSYAGITRQVSPRNTVIKRLLQVLGEEPTRDSAAASTLTHWAISQDPWFV